VSEPTAYVVLEDGTRFDGLACGADAPAVGEIVFTTSMSGYQEAMTDPSYAGQLLTFTYPQIGNYGVSAQAMESDRVRARAAIMRAAVDHHEAGRAEEGWLTWLKANGIPAITDLDTRALVRHIRDQGAMRGGVFPATVPHARARQLIDQEPDMAGRDLVRDVTPERVIVLEPPSSPPGELASEDEVFATHAMPSASGRPNIRLRFWTACEAAPFQRLSIAANTITLPVRTSRCTEIRQMFVSRTSRTPGGPDVISTNGSRS
jgi:carbamoyl-phosphate synthase small subunit